MVIEDSVNGIYAATQAGLDIIKYNNSKIKETNKALKEGYELIYGGWLKSGNWSGELDFLEINNEVKSTNINLQLNLYFCKSHVPLKIFHDLMQTF